VGERGAGVDVIEGEHQNRARQALLAVLDVGAVPLHASGAEAATQVGGHRHHAAVGGVARHAREWRVFREAHHGAVGVVVRAGHPIVAFVQQVEYLFHGIDAGEHVGHASADHVLFGEVDEIDSCIISHGILGVGSAGLAQRGG